MVYAGLERHEFVIPVVNELPKINEFIDGYYKDTGLSPSPLPKRSFEEPFIKAIHKCLDDCSGIPSPSLFKICAAVTIGFMQCRPVGPVIPNTRISQLHNHQNAYISFAYCCRCLHNATIQPNGKPRYLKNPIRISDHFLYDLIHMIGHAKPTSLCFSLLALLYESLVYQTNPKAQNSIVVELS